MATVDECEYLTTGDVAARFGVHINTVYGWVDKGMPCLRPTPGTIRYVEKEIRTWMANRAQSPKTAEA